jgi:hypothetical protein
MKLILKNNQPNQDELSEDKSDPASDFSEEEDDELDPFYISNRDIIDPYHELEYSEDDQKNYMGRNTYRVKQEHRENRIFFEEEEEVSEE